MSSKPEPMTAETSCIEEREASGTLRVFAPHLLSLVFPLSSLLFLWTGPHPWWLAPVFLVPTAVLNYLDSFPHRAVQRPRSSLPALPFDLLLYLLAALQFVTLYSLGRFFLTQQLFSVDTIVAMQLIGNSSGFAIITAHELMHRRVRWERALGRALLCTTLYDHFYVEHIRGHHRNVGMPNDSATAGFGETYEKFWRRAVIGGFRSAWQLELQRIRGSDRRSTSLLLKNKVLHGLVVEGALLLTMLLAFGVAAAVSFLLQAFTAVRRLEAVNYMQHWGLRRRGSKPEAADSWDTHSWLTFHTLSGLSRHSDHHLNWSRPYQQLQLQEAAPVLPMGYLSAISLVMFNNPEYIRRATVELQRLRLGPFASSAESEGVRQPARAVRVPWNQVPLRIRLRVLAQRWGTRLGVLLLVSLGMMVESNVQLRDALLSNVPIYAVLLLAIHLQRVLERRLHDALALCAVALLLAGAGSCIDFEALTGTLRSGW